jgi:hypothetical protein
MTTILRLVTMSAVAVVALALAGNALATQRLSVSQSATGLTIKVSQDVTDPQPAKIQVYVPAGYTLGTVPAAGTKVGTTTGNVIARDAGNISLPLTGDVLVEDPAKHAKDVCSPGNNAAVLDLQLSVAGQTINLPVYINPTSGAEAGLGGLKMAICLGSVDTPLNTPGRSPQGAQLKDATFTVNNLFTAPAGPVRWTSLWTPYAAGTGLPNVAGTVEARAFAGPGAVTLTAKVTSKKKRIVLLQGKVTSSGIGIGGATVRILINGKLSKFAKKTIATGAYQLRLQKTVKQRRTTAFQAQTTVAERDVTSTGCASPSVPPVPCVSATQGAFTAKSRKVLVRL